MESLTMANHILEGSIVHKGGQRLFDKYLEPKIRPYTCLQSIKTSAVPS